MSIANSQCEHGLIAQDCGFCAIQLLEEQKRFAESAILRSRRGWVNAIDLGILHPSCHDEARAIITELTVALAKMGSKEVV